MGDVSNGPPPQPVPVAGVAPLIGRDEELAAAGEALAGGGCVIAGLAGVGKSRLAAELASSVPGTIERVLATRSAQGLPFGAFAHLLSADGVTGPEIPAFIAHLRARHGDGPVTVVVDDAHLLDDASAALVLALAQTRTARLLLTIRSHEPAPDAVVSLWKDRRIERIDIQPLSRADTRRLVEAVLGAGCHTSVTSKAFELTEGNPLYVTELLRDSARSGALAPLDGRWEWTGTRPVLTRLRDLIEARTAVLSEHGRRALELLALSAPIALELFREVADAAAIEELERAGLAQVTDRRGPIEVEVVHPLYGEVTADAMPRSVAHDHRRTLAHALRSRGTLTGEQVVRAATWALESGDVDHDLFVRASQEALRATSGVPGMGWDREEADLAIRLADAAGATFEAAMAGALGRIAVNRGDEVEALLAPYEEAASRSSLEVASAYLRARVFALFWSRTDNERALDVLDRSRHWHSEPAWSAFSAMVRGWILLELGRVEDARLVLEPFVGAADVDPTIRLELLVVYGLTLTRLGQIDRAEALEPEIVRLAELASATGVGTPWAVYLVDAFVRIEAARDVDGVAARLGAAHREAQSQGNETLAASIQMVLGRLALIRGHVADAVVALREAVDGMLYASERTALGLAHTYLARAHSLRGETDAAAEAVAQAERLLRERPENMRLAVELARARAWVDVSCGRVAAARVSLLEVAELAGEDVTGRSEAIYSAVRLGADAGTCAQQLAELDARSDNELYATCTAHARALASGDADAQLEAATQFAALGVDLFAAEAAALASHAFLKRGSRAEARRAAALAALHADRCQGATTPHLLLRPEVADLTPREREVVSLVARGQTNRAIAAELSVSVRTVESYVLRACTKLGVNSRRELAPFVGAGGRGASEAPP